MRSSDAQSVTARRSALRALVKLSVFSLAFILFVLLGSIFFVKTDLFARMMILEMQERNDLELVFVGSSIARDHFNVQRISEATGKRAFNASIPCLGLQGSIALTEELYRTNNPADIVLVVEPYTFETEREGIEAEDILMPWLSSVQTRIDYYKRLVAADGWYLDRLLLFRDFGAESPADILKTIGLRFFPHSTFRRLGNVAMDKGAKAVYQGSGFVRYETKIRADSAVREKLQRVYTGWYYDLLPASKEMLLTYHDLLAAHGTNLLVFIYPNMNAHNLADPIFLGYNESLMRFCRKNGIDCVNFSLAKPELLPNLDRYYFDIYHLTGEAADIFSDAVARFLNLRYAGKDTSSLFYGSNGEYLDAIDYVTNVWLERLLPGEEWNPAREQSPDMLSNQAPGWDIFLANCNHGPSVVPQYRFSALRADGSETFLTDWQEESVYSCPSGSLDALTIRIYARAPGREQEAVWYDLSLSNPY